MTQDVPLVLWNQGFDTKDSRGTTSTLSMVMNVALADDEVRFTPYLNMRVDEDVSRRSWQRLKEHMLRYGEVAVVRGRRSMRVIITDDPWSDRYKVILQDPPMTATVFKMHEYNVRTLDWMLRRVGALTSSAPHLMMLARTIGDAPAPDGLVMEDLSLLGTLWTMCDMCDATMSVRNMVSELQYEMESDPEGFDAVLTMLARVKHVRCSWEVR